MDFFLFIGGSLMIVGLVAMDFDLSEFSFSRHVHSNFGDSEDDAGVPIVDIELIDPEGVSYDPAAYSGEFTGTEGDDLTNAGDFPISQAFFLGEGADTLVATDGFDFVEAEDGDDTLDLGLGDDIAFGGDGDDTIDGEEGDDTLVGNAGDDDLVGGDGVDQLFGGDGNDTLFGGPGTDAFSGDAGDDVLYGILASRSGTADSDALLGGEGDDTLHLGGGDLGTGGTGADSIVLYEPQETGSIINVTDFDPEEDVISIFYTPEASTDTGGSIAPELTLTPNEDNTGAQVALDGTNIAIILGGQSLSVSDITLLTDEI